MAINHFRQRQWLIAPTILVAITLAAILAFVVRERLTSLKPPIPVVRLAERIERDVAGAVPRPGIQASLPHVLEWTQPRAGWLYVTDDQPENFRVVLLDPDRWQVRGVIQAGEDAELVMSPDGERLYLFSYHDETNWLEVLDSRTAHLEYSLPVPKRGRATIPWDTPMAALSGDGRWLYYLQHAPDTASGQWEFGLGGFDVSARTFAAGAVPLKGCGTPLPVVRRSGAGVICDESHVLFLVDGVGFDAVKRVPLPREDERVQVGWRELWRVSGATASGGGRTIHVVTGVGRVYEIDGETGSLESSFRIPLPEGHVVVSGPAVSSGGDRLYFGVSSIRNIDAPGPRSVDKLAVVDLRRQALKALVDVEASFWSPTVASRGTKLYATAQEKGAVLLFEEVGDRPRLVVVRKVGRFVSSVTEAR